MKARVNDVVITADSQVIVCITADKSIELMRLNDYVPVSPLSTSTDFPLKIQTSPSRYCTGNSSGLGSYETLQ